MGSRHGQRNREIFMAVSFYWVVSISLVFLNKGAMTVVDAPMFMTWTQVVLAVWGCFIMSKYRRSIPGLEFFPPFDIHAEVALKVLPLTLAFIGMVLFNNLCIKYVNVSFYQVARSLTIIFNILFTYIIMGEKTSLRACATVAVVFLGYVLGCQSEFSISDLSVMGAIYGVTASVFVSLYAIYVKKVLPAVDNNTWKLMIYNNVIAAALMPVLVILFGEFRIIADSPVVWTGSFWFNYIFMTGIFGTLINIATYAQIQMTSPLTHNISGTAKSGFQTLLAVLVKGELLLFSGVLGVILVLGGSLLYTYVRSLDMAAAKPVLPQHHDSTSREKELETRPLKAEQA